MIARQIISIVDGAALQFLSLGAGVFEAIVEQGISDVQAGLARRATRRAG